MFTNQVITKSYPENIEGGFMICGINYGYSRAEEEVEMAGAQILIDEPSFFSDRTFRSTDRFKKRILKWLKSWGLEFATEPGQERGFERSFFQCNWLDSQTRSVSSNGNINNEMLVNSAEGFLNLLEQRRPSVVLLFGAKLLDALNDSRIRPRVIALLGERTDPRSYTAEPHGYMGKKFAVRVQKFGETVVIAAPHPQAQGLTDEYMAAIKLPVFAMEKLFSKCFNMEHSSFPTDDEVAKANDVLEGLQDPLFPEASIAFRIDQELPISALQIQFRIGYRRAICLYKALTSNQANPQE